MDVSEIKIEQYFHDQHFLRFAPLFCRFYREVNGEDLEVDTPVVLNGKTTLVKRFEAEIHGAPLQGVFCKVAIFDQEIIGFIWYRACLHHLVLPIDAFYVRPEWRSTGVARIILNSFCNPFNQGRFEIVAVIHANNRPVTMLTAFHGYQEVRRVNDRDLVMIRGEWRVDPIPEQTADLGKGNEDVTLLKPAPRAEVTFDAAQFGQRATDRQPIATDYSPGGGWRTTGRKSA